MHEWWAVGVRREGTTQQREKRMRGAFLVAHSHRVNGGVAGTHFASSHVVIFFHAHDEPTAHCPVLHLRTSPRPCVVLHVVATIVPSITRAWIRYTGLSRAICAWDSKSS